MNFRRDLPPIVTMLSFAFALVSTAGGCVFDSYAEQPRTEQSSACPDTSFDDESCTVGNQSDGLTKVWASSPVPSAQKGTFSVGFDVVPSKASMNGVVGLSNGPATAFSHLAAIVRFWRSGFLEARDGSMYTSGAQIPYVAGAKYHVQIEGSLATHRYDVRVTPPGGSPIALALGYAFRTEQAGATQLDNVGSYAVTGDLVVTNVTVDDVDGPPPPTVPPASGLLFAPPAQSNTHVITNVDPDVDTRFPRASDPGVSTSIGRFFPPDRDVQIHLPKNVTLTKGIVVAGGRHVRIIGGKWKLASGTTTIVLDAGSGSFFVEGAHIDANHLAADAIVLRNRPTSQVPGARAYDTYVQNVFVENIDGIPSGVHGDVIQNQSSNVALGYLKVENLTGITDYQGFFIPNRAPFKGFHFRNVDLRYGSSPSSGALFWFRDNQSQPVFPGTLENVWAGPHPSVTPWYDVSVWPKSKASKYDVGTYDWPSWGTVPAADGLSVTFSAANQITGSIQKGAPPGGSFVTPSKVGWSYVSPHP
jgi:hypothetical protein